MADQPMADVLLLSCTKSSREMYYQYVLSCSVSDQYQKPITEYSCGGGLMCTTCCWVYFFCVFVSPSQQQRQNLQVSTKVVMLLAMSTCRCDGDTQPHAIICTHICILHTRTHNQTYTTHTQLHLHVVI